MKAELSSRFYGHFCHRNQITLPFLSPLSCPTSTLWDRSVPSHSLDTQSTRLFCGLLLLPELELYQEWPLDASQLQRQNQPLAWMEDEVWGKWTSQSLAACGMPPHRAMFQKEPSHCWAESLMEAHTATARPLSASVLPERTYLGSQSNRKRDFYQSIIHFLKD